MEYAYATCLLSETGAEINEENLKAVLEATGTDVQESRVKAVVAALEGVRVGGVAGELGDTRSGREPERPADPTPDPMEKG